MPFLGMVHLLLANLATHPPTTDAASDGPWFNALVYLFPTSEGYMISNKHRPHINIEVIKMISTTPFTLQTVLIIEAKKSTKDWESGIPVLERRLKQRADAAFAGTARKKVYWIGAIGPHWKYGETEDDGSDPRALIDWHHTAHDLASFDDLQALVRLVSAL